MPMTPPPAPGLAGSPSGLAGKMQPPGAGAQASGAAPSSPSGAPNDPEFWNWLHGLFQQQKSAPDAKPEGSDEPTDVNAVAGAKKPADDDDSIAPSRAVPMA
jgi:hypothetical protein